MLALKIFAQYLLENELGLNGIGLDSGSPHFQTSELGDEKNQIL